MTPENRNFIEQEVERVVIRFFHHLDSREYDKLAGLFAADGVWHRPGKELCGRTAIMEAMHARPAGLITQHIATNIVVDVVDADHAEATLYLTVFSHAGGAAPQTPAPVELPNLVGIYREKMIRTPDGWRISEITSRPNFRR